MLADTQNTAKLIKRRERQEGTQFVMLAMCGRFTRMPGFWSCSRLLYRS